MKELLKVLYKMKRLVGVVNTKMERFTETKISLKERVGLQAALEKLAWYEDAEEDGDIVYTVREAYYIVGGTILKGRVTEIHIKLLQVEEGPSYELWYDLMVYDRKIKEEKLYRGRLGVSVFNTEEDAIAYMSSPAYESVFKEI